MPARWRTWFRMHNRQELVLGKKAQHKIQQSTVAILGLGALGTVAAELLLRAGVGKLIIIDRDVVEESNLSRQMLYTHTDVGRSKALAAQERLDRIGTETNIISHAIHFHATNCTVLEAADLVLDCTDNLQTRMVLNDYCRKKKKKWIYAAAIKTAGYVMPILPTGPCVRCFLKEGSLDTCETVGVLNTITTSIAALQVQIALEILAGKRIEPTLFQYDLETKTLRQLKVTKNPSCPTCQHKFEYLQPQTESKLVHFCGSNRYQVFGKKKNLSELKQKWEKIGVIQEDGSTLRFRNILLFADGRALIKAKSEAEALAAYSKWVGN